MDMTLLVAILLFDSALLEGGAQLSAPLHTIPQGTESVNGSSINAGCEHMPSSISDSVRLCGRFGIGGGARSYLFDGDSPALNTSAPNWASQLVTVRKNRETFSVPYEHVVLTFDYTPAVSLALVELDLFLCPEWNIGAPNISVYADKTGGGSFTFLPGFYMHVELYSSATPSQSSCESLSTVAIPLRGTAIPPALTWYIAVSFNLQPDIEWIHVGEIRFFEAEPKFTSGPRPRSSQDIPCTHTNDVSSPIDPTAAKYFPDPATTTAIITFQPSPRLCEVCDCQLRLLNSAVLVPLLAFTIESLLVFILLLVIVVQCVVIKRMWKSSPTGSAPANDHIYSDTVTVAPSATTRTTSHYSQT